MSNFCIESIAVIDDDKDVRASYSDIIEDASWECVDVDKLRSEVDDEIASISKRADALICDYHLTKHNYSKFNGDVLVAAAYKSGFPALLCTAFDNYSSTISRRSRQWIPVILESGSLDAASIQSALQVCWNEFRGDFDAKRKPWRSLVRIDEIDTENNYVYVVVPAWAANSKIVIPRSDFPGALLSKLDVDSRLYAKVNIGADSAKDIYFYDWEVPS